MKTYFDSVSVLTEALAELDPNLPVLWRNEASGDSAAGIWAVRRKFVPKKTSFTDSFDHDLYSHTIYAAPDDPEEFPEAQVCVMLGGEEKRFAEAADIKNAGDLAEFLSCADGEDILIGVSGNFEHEGFVVKGIHLDYNEKNNALTLKFHLEDRWR